MDSLINSAARALSGGDPLAALNRVALRSDPPALALRGIAMAQLGDLERARTLLRAAVRAFGPTESVYRARCVVAEAEVALVSRDLGKTLDELPGVRAVLEAAGDLANGAHAAYLDARRHLLTGHLDHAETLLSSFDRSGLPLTTRVGCNLVEAGIAIRRVRAGPAHSALEQARRGARKAAIPALTAEVEATVKSLQAPTARILTQSDERLATLSDVEALFSSGALIVDACRHVLRAGPTVISMTSRPVLFSALRTLAEAWPADAAREVLLKQIFGARQADESHRVRLRVEIARLRNLIAPLADLRATKTGFVLRPRSNVDIVLLLPPTESDHGAFLALLADGEAWSSSALAEATGMSARTVQRAMKLLAGEGAVEPIGQGRSRRWMATPVPGFPTSLLLPVAGIPR